MRVVLLCAEYSLPNNGGGIGTYTHNHSRNLVHAGHQVHIITQILKDMPRHCEEDGVHIHYMGIPRLPPVVRTTGRRFKNSDLAGAYYTFRRSIHIRNEVVKLAEKYGVDIVHAPDWGAEALWLTIKPFVPVVVTLHGPRFYIHRINRKPHTAGSSLMERLEQQAILRASVVTSPSAGLRRIVADEFHSPSLEEKFIVVPNPIDTDLFRPIDMSDPVEQNQYPVVTYVGRLEYRKGVHVLAAAIPIIRVECPQVRFRFIGSDTLTAPDGGSMQAYASSLAQPYADAIEFTGPLPRHSLPTHYSYSTIVVLPSLHENYPYSCAEAMACGACVVASKIGGLDEMIQDGETGYLVPPGDPAALAQVLIRLLARPDKRKYVGANARAAVQERMNPDKVTAQTIEIYHQVLA